MKKTSLEIMIEKLKNGEAVTCQKCKKGVIIYKESPEKKYPEVYCDNIECNARVHFN